MIQNESKSFIVDDNYVTSSSYSDEKISHESTRSSSTEDDQIFYIKTNKKIEKTSFTVHRNNRLNISTTSSSSDEYESDESLRRNETPRIRRKNSESAIDTVFRTPKTKSISACLFFF